MRSNASTVRAHYESELTLLRDEAVAFGREYPAVARELSLGHGRSGDPHVELLLQSFAYLAGRLRHQVEQDAALLPNALMAELHPHLAAPLPSLLVAQLRAGADSKGVLARGRELEAEVTDTVGHRQPCRFSVCHDVPVVPVEVIDLQQVATAAYDGLQSDRTIHSVLKLGLRSLGVEPLSTVPVERLQIWLDIESLQVWKLYELLQRQLAGVAVDCGTGEIRHGGTLRWVGFEDTESVLANDLVSHPGHRLVQEYFAYPERFLFFEISGLDLRGASDRIDLLFLLKSGVDKSMQLTPGTMRLNCVPLVNLFAHRLEPIALDHCHYEYRLAANHQANAHTEIYRVESLEANAPGEGTRAISPYFSFEGAGRATAPRYFYIARRAESTHPGVPGTDTYVSFLDLDLKPCLPAGEVVGGRVTCTNRRHVEQLRLGDRLRVDGPAPVRVAHVVSKPTPYQPPKLVGDRPWALVSQLLLNHLSLSSGTQALPALKQLLRVQLGPANHFGVKQIDALCKLDVKPMLRPMDIGGRRTLVDGWGITVTVDAARFDGGSPLLFGEVLSRFFGLYASTNTMTQLSLETLDDKGRVMSWPPRIGAQTVL